MVRGKAKQPKPTDMILVAFDPGETTGMAVIKPPFTILVASQGDDEEALLQSALSFLPSFAVIEEYRLYPGVLRGQGWARPPSAELIGQLKETLKAHGIPVYMQQPSARVRISTNVLKAAKVYLPNHPHANDAIRHGLYYLWFKEGWADHPDVQAVFRLIADKALKEQ